jgi:HEAT repeat protein
MIEIPSSGEMPEEPVSGRPGLEAHKSGIARKVAQTLFAIVVGAGAVLWACRVVWDTWHPVLAAARRLGASETAARLEAIGQVADLSWTNQTDAINALSGALADPDSDVRVAAAKSLGLLGASAMKAGSATKAVKAAVPGLFKLLKDQSPTVRIEAIQVVGILSIPPTSSQGRGGRAGGGSTAARASVVDLPQLTDAYTQMLGDQDAEVRLAALLALSAIASHERQEPPKALIAALEDKSVRIREAAIDAVAGFNQKLDPVIPFLVRGLGPDEPAEVRRAAARALSKIQPSAISADTEAVPALIKLLRQLVPDTVPNGDGATVAKALSRIAPGTPLAGEAVKALTEALKAPLNTTREAAVSALAPFGPKGAAGALSDLHALQKKETDPRVISAIDFTLKSLEPAPKERSPLP